MKFRYVVMVRIASPGPASLGEVGEVLLRAVMQCVPPGSFVTVEPAPRGWWEFWK